MEEIAIRKTVEGVKLPTGVAVAAMLAAGAGLVVFALTNLSQEVGWLTKDQLIWLGGWLPNAPGIGPYAGKETAMAIAWLGSWLGLHLALRRRAMNVRLWFGVTLVLVFAATLLMWPPVFLGIAGG